MTDEAQRIEIRDGREFVVKVLPEQKPPKAKKSLKTKRMARGLAVGTGSSTAQRLKVKKRRKRGLKR